MQRRLDDTKVIEQSITENLVIAYQQFLEAADAAVIAKYQQFVAPRRKTEADICYGQFTAAQWKFSGAF